MRKLYDGDAWKKCRNEDLWVFDKLILSKKLGYRCGPAGVEVPVPGYYVVRPITNTFGMGVGAEVKYLKHETDHLGPGKFWCKQFHGPHYSVDYHGDGKQKFCVQGFRDKKDPLYKWREWKLIDKKIPCPPIVDTLVGKYDTINCEFIGDKLIEIHLRGNPDFANGEKRLIVVWKGENKQPPKGMKFIPSDDYKREGFFVQY